VIDPSDQSLQVHPTPQVPGAERPPGGVYAAAVVTWIGATGTAALTVFLTAVLLLVAGPLFDAFEGGLENPRWLAVGAAVVVVTLSAAADVVAFFMLRGRRWAQWVLVGLSTVAVVCGVMSAYYIAPLVVTAAAVAVIVLLLLPDARAWFRAERPHQ
jgi:hypothetical protein